MGERRLTGVGVTPRAGVGTAYWYDRSPEVNQDGEDCDPAEQQQRFESAQEQVSEELAAERERVAERIGEEEAAVFDAHQQFLTDPEIKTPIKAAIDEGKSAEQAVQTGFGEGIEQFEAMEGMMAERADDLRDIRDRLLRVLTGSTDTAAIPSGSIVLAERLTPSDTVSFDLDDVAGIATERGGRSSHAAIIARSIGLPAVVGLGEDLVDLAGERVAVDGSEGVLIVDPDEKTIDAIEGAAQESVRHEQVSTADGRPIEVAANVTTPETASHAAEQGADGIGLFRSEMLFLDRNAPPDEAEQYEHYQAAREQFETGERVIVRTLDIGGDKPIEYLDLDPEENGFLGVRGIRLSLGEHRDLFETQLRAILRATAGGDDDASLAMMFPMVTAVEELDEALELVETVAAELDDEGSEYAVPELGVMVETPAAVEMAAELASRVSFLSIGTNDLTGYTMATQRDIDSVADLHDPLQPAVLRAIDRTVKRGHDGDAWVGMCGEMAGEPELTELLVGIGLDELSASAVTVPEIKAQISEIDSEQARELAGRVLAAERQKEVEELLDL